MLVVIISKTFKLPIKLDLITLKVSALECPSLKEQFEFSNKIKLITLYSLLERTLLITLQRMKISP